MPGRRATQANAWLPARGVAHYERRIVARLSRSGTGVRPPLAELTCTLGQVALPASEHLTRGYP